MVHARGLEWPPAAKRDPFDYEIVLVASLEKQYKFPIYRMENTWTDQASRRVARIVLPLAHHLINPSCLVQPSFSESLNALTDR
jgi:hypothetical protein